MRPGYWRTRRLRRRSRETGQVIEANDGDACTTAPEIERAKMEDARMRAREIAAMNIHFADRIAGGYIEHSAAAVAASRRLLDSLRGAISELSRLMRDLGQSHEQAIAVAEEVFVSATKQAAVELTVEVEREVLALHSNVMQWILEAYLAQNDASGRCSAQSRAVG
jgi:hypothetical protein